MFSRGTILPLALVFLASSAIFVNIVLPSSESNVSDKASENTWTQKAPMPTPRSALSVAAVDGKIYALGGKTRGLNGFLLATNEMYDPANDTWAAKAPMPTPRAFFTVAVFQNKIYCFGGLIGNSTQREQFWKGCTANEVYDPSTDTWETKAPMPTARWRLQANTANGKIFLIGGAPNASLNEVYDPETDNWTAKAPILYNETITYLAYPFKDTINYAASDGFTSAAIDNKIFWIGQAYSESKGTKKLTLMYNPENDSWSPRTPPPEYSETYTAISTTGEWAPKQIYVFGHGHIIHTNVAYNPVTDKWSQAKGIPTTNSEFSVAVADDQLYAIGGRYLYSASAENEQYTPFGYGTIAPTISVLTPQNGTSTVKNSSLVFTLNRPALWMGYNMDCQNNMTLAGNITLGGLSQGFHNLTVYVQDTFGNSAASETIFFTVAETAEPLPTILLGVAVIVVAFAVAFLLFYHRNLSLRKR